MTSPRTGGGAGPGQAARPRSGGGCTVLLYGKPQRATATIAAALATRLRSERRPVENLTTPTVRSQLAPGGPNRLGEDRAAWARLGFVAALLARNGVTALCPCGQTYPAVLAEIRAIHARAGAGILVVHVWSEAPVPAQRAGGWSRLAGPKGRSGPLRTARSDLIVPAGENMLLQAVAVIYDSLATRDCPDPL